MRADKFLADKFGSRSKAKDKLLRGLVFANGRALSPDSELIGTENLTFVEENSFVSRGGDKLERAISVFEAQIQGIYIDLGASTGGFTDCLLRHGAKKVYCVDVGENQLDECIRSDSRVVVMDRTNARYLKKQDFPDKINGIVSDLSFISLKLILPVLYELADESTDMLLLFKPQFECGKGKIPKSGILPLRQHAALLEEFYDFALALRLNPINIVNAPIHEGKNIEYIIRLQKGEYVLKKHEFLHLAEFLYENRVNF